MFIERSDGSGAQPAIEGISGLWCVFDRDGDRVLQVTVLARGDTEHTSEFRFHRGVAGRGSTDQRDGTVCCGDQKLEDTKLKSIGRKENKRQGMALPLTLIVLLVARAMVAVAFVFIENMMSTTKMKSDDEFRLNAAIAGLERGKTWLYDRIVSDDIPSLVAAGAINAVTASDDYKELLVSSGGAVPNPTLSFTLGDADVKVRIYDLAYDFGETLTFEPGIPPRM